MKLDLDAPIPSAVMVVLIPLVLGWVLYWPMPQGKPMRNIETEIVRIKLSGVNFDMPINYMYSEAMETYNRWPEPKNNRVEVNSISLSVLLPDLRAYQPQDDSRWRMSGHGDRIELSIASIPKNSDWHNTFVDLIKERVTSGSATREAEIYGLSIFKDLTNTSTYIPQDGTHKLIISCDSPEGLKSPRCFAKSTIVEGITLEYYFGLNNLIDGRK